MESDSQLSLEFAEERSALDPKDVGELRDILYKMLAKHYINKVELEMELSYDLIDVIWQIPYEKLPVKLKARFDAFVANMISKLGTNQSQLFLYIGDVSDEMTIHQLNRLSEAISNIIAQKTQQLQADDKV